MYNFFFACSLSHFSDIYVRLRILNSFEFKSQNIQPWWTGTISGHTDYQRKMHKILRLIDAAEDDLEITDQSLPSSMENSFEKLEPIKCSINKLWPKSITKRRSRSLSSLPKPKKRTSKLRKNKSLHNIALS